jgi:hypothetical protein
MNRSRITRPALLAIVLLAAAPACRSDTERSGPSDTGSAASTDATVSTTSAGSTDSTTTLASTVPAVASNTSDALISVFGFPDAFRTEVQVVDGESVMRQTYVYAEIGQRFDLVNGVVVGNEAIEPLPEDTLLPLHYSVYDVWPGMTRDEVIAAMAGVDLTPIDASSFTTEGGTVLAGGQIVIGLLDDVVVYVETFPLVPDPSGEYEALLQEVAS